MTKSFVQTSYLYNIFFIHVPLPPATLTQPESVFDFRASGPDTPFEPENNDNTMITLLSRTNEIPENHFSGRTNGLHKNVRTRLPFTSHGHPTTIIIITIAYIIVLSPSLVVFDHFFFHSDSPTRRTPFYFHAFAREPERIKLFRRRH